MLILKFTCDKDHHFNSKLIAEKFRELIGESKDMAVKESPDVVKLYLGEKSLKNVSLTVEVTDEDVATITR